MKICVLIKQVPNEDAIIKISPDGSGIIEDNLTYCTNEPDTYALEEALLIKEKMRDCEVVACTMGKDAASQILKEALAKGADRAILIENSNFENLDPLGISKIISNILQKEEFDLILSGLQSDDSGHAQTGLLIAELLDMTHASLKGIMGAKKKQLDKYNPNELEGELPKSYIETRNIYIPQKSKETKYIDGDTDSIVEELIKILKDDIKAIN